LQEQPFFLILHAVAAVVRLIYIVIVLNTCSVFNVHIFFDGVPVATLYSTRLFFGQLYNYSHRLD